MHSTEKRVTLELLYNMVFLLQFPVGFWIQRKTKKKICFKAGSIDLLLLWNYCYICSIKQISMLLITAPRFPLSKKKLTSIRSRKLKRYNLKLQMEDWIYKLMKYVILIFFPFGSWFLSQCMINIIIIKGKKKSSLKLVNKQIFWKK